MLFMAVVILSMIMPLWIDGRLQISSNQLANLYMEPLRLNEHNIKNPLTVIVGVVFVTFLVWANDTERKLLSTIKAYVIGGVGTALWGLFQFLCSHVLDIEYPYYLFNNAKTESTQGFLQQLEIDGQFVARVSSVTNEPSILAKYLLTVIPILLTSVWMKHALFSQRWDKVCLGVVIVTLVLATSTTGYLGLVAVFFVTSVVLNRYHPTALRFLGWILFVGVLVGSSIVIFPQVAEVLTVVTLEKASSGSFLERVLSIITSWGYFLEYPVLGVGWAMVTSTDVIVNLLANSGVLGLATFSSLVIYVVLRTLQGLNFYVQKNGLEKHGHALIISLGLLISLVVSLMVGELTGIEFYLGYFYFTIGMLVAANRIVRASMSGTEPRRFLSKNKPTHMIPIGNQSS